MNERMRKRSRGIDLRVSLSFVGPLPLFRDKSPLPALHRGRVWLRKLYRFPSGSEVQGEAKK